MSTSPTPSDNESNSADVGPHEPDVEDEEPPTQDETAEHDTEEAEAGSGTEEFNVTTQQQMQFGDGGSLEPKEDAVETTLDQYGLDVSNRDPDTRLDRPEASGLMADDRPEVRKQDPGEQSNLFADAEEDQQTLSGDRAQNNCLFEED